MRIREEDLLDFHFLKSKRHQFFVADLRSTIIINHCHADCILIALDVHFSKCTRRLVLALDHGLELHDVICRLLKLLASINLTNPLFLSCHLDQI